MTRRAFLGHAVPCAVTLAAMLSPLGTRAQAWPTKPVRIMVGASPGGGTDILARLFAERFAQEFKQSFVVENRPGASNTIAAEVTARADPDGQTLLVATTTAQAIAPHLLKLKFDPLKDIAPIGLIAVMPNVLVVSSSSPYRTAKELLTAMQAKPGEFKYASSGVGSTQHIAGEAFNAATGARSIHVPYKGSAQAHLDILAGQVEIMFDSTSSAMSQIRAGKFRPIAVSAARRTPELPDVPTLAEQGINGADVATWYGLFTTGGTPGPIIARLNASLLEALKATDVKSRINALGGEIEALDIDAFARFNRDEYERYGKLIKSANIKAE